MTSMPIVLNKAATRSSNSTRVHVHQVSARADLVGRFSARRGGEPDGMNGCLVVGPC
jgi:hypothetical protein